MAACCYPGALALTLLEGRGNPGCAVWAPWLLIEVRLPAGGQTLIGNRGPALSTAPRCAWPLLHGAGPLWLLGLLACLPLAACSSTNSQGRDPKTLKLLNMGFALCAHCAKQPEVGTPRPLHPMCRCGLTAGWPYGLVDPNSQGWGPQDPKRPVCPPSPGTWSPTLPIGLFCPCFVSGRLRHARGLLRVRTGPEFGSCAGVVSAGKCGRLTCTAPGSTGARPLPAVVPSASPAVAPSLAAVSEQQPSAPGARPAAPVGPFAEGAAAEAPP